MNHLPSLPVLPLLLALVGGALNAADQPAATPAPAPAATAPAPATAAATPPADDKGALKATVSYQVGLQMGDAVAKYQLDANEVARGIHAMVDGKDKPVDQEKFRDLMTKYTADLASHQVTGNKDFLDKNAKKPGVKTLADGLQYEVLASGPGTGKSPTATDTVKVAYKGTLPNGSVFDASENHGGSVTFQVNGVIKGWTEVLQLMKEGDKWKVTVPAELGYGAQGMPPTIPPNQILIFEISLLQVNPPAEVPPAPGK
jgi:FKBP-type peptidyl-prolyl cis-trans isomerase